MSVLNGQPILEFLDRRNISRSFQIILKFIMSQKLIKMDERKKDPARVLFTVLLSTRY